MMKPLLTMTLVTALAAPLLTTQASAMYGNSLFGRNPDQLVTISERQRRQRAVILGKQKTLYPDFHYASRGLDVQETEYFIRQYKRGRVDPFVGRFKSQKPKTYN